MVVVATLAFGGASEEARPAGAASAGAVAAGGVPLVFSSYRDGNSEIYAVRADGSGLRRLTHHKALDAFPSLSPDGKRVAFVSTRDGNSELYAMNLDGTALVRLTWHRAVDAEPDWSPDGTRIAFTSTRTGGADIYTARSSDGGGLARLTSDRAIEISPAWSPAGTQLAFVSLRSGGGDVYRIQSKGGAAIRLTTSRAPDLFPAWSPDGSKLAFASLRSGHSDIYTIKPDGSGGTRLTRSDAIESEPAWSPDGSRLAISSTGAGRRNLDLFLLAADGTGAVPLASHAARDVSPDWAFGPAGPPLVQTLNVVSTPDTTRRATATIGRLGGTLETDSADGSHFKLFVPPGALSTERVLSITPTAVGGLGAIATTTRYGVEFEPSGLTFAVPATLVITPPAGAQVDQLYAFSWRDGTPGIDVGLPDVRAGELRVSVPHFSGVALLEATIASNDDMLTLALVSMPGIGGPEAARLATLVAGLPGTSADVAAYMMSLHDTVVSPAIDQASADIVKLRVAAAHLNTFGILFQGRFAGIGSLAVPNSSLTLDTVHAAARTRFVNAARSFLAHYAQPVCDGSVVSVADWFAIPIQVVAELAAFGEPAATTFCATATVEALAFPTALQPGEQFVDAALRGGVLAPAQTPGGSPALGGKLFPEPTEFALDVAGATFIATGSRALTTLTGADGRSDFRLDRGVDAAARGRITVTGSADVRGLWEEVRTVYDGIDPFVSVNLVARPPAETHVRFRSPPQESLLVPGGPTELCVDLLNEEDTLLAATTASWSLSGPGSLSGGASVSNSLGVACIQYRHPETLDPALTSATVTARATHRNATGSDSVLLELRAGLLLEILERRGSVGASACAQASPSSTCFDFGPSQERNDSLPGLGSFSLTASAADAGRMEGCACPSEGDGGSATSDASYSADLVPSGTFRFEGMLSVTTAKTGGGHAGAGAEGFAAVRFRVSGDDLRWRMEAADDIPAEAGGCAVELREDASGTIFSNRHARSFSGDGPLEPGVYTLTHSCNIVALTSSGAPAAQAAFTAAFVVEP
jgi:hypothetical protein